MQPDLISEWSWGFGLIDWFDFWATFISLAKHFTRHANKKWNGHRAGSQKEKSDKQRSREYTNIVTGHCKWEFTVRSSDHVQELHWVSWAYYSSKNLLRKKHRNLPWSRENVHVQGFIHLFDCSFISLQVSSLQSVLRYLIYQLRRERSFQKMLNFLFLPEYF